MKTRRLILSALTLAALAFTVACGPRNTKKLETEGNDKIKASVANMSELYEQYNINLAPEFVTSKYPQTAQTIDWQQYTPEQRTQIKSKLEKQLQLVGRVKEIANHKGMKFESTGMLEASIEYARAYLQSLKRSENGEIGAGQNEPARKDSEPSTGPVQSTKRTTQKKIAG